MIHVATSAAIISLHHNDRMEEYDDIEGSDDDNSTSTAAMDQASVVNKTPPTISRHTSSASLSFIPSLHWPCFGGCGGDGSSSIFSNRSRIGQKVCVIGILCFVGSIITTLQVIQTLPSQGNTNKHIKTMSMATTITKHNVQSPLPSSHHPPPKRRSFPKWGTSITEEENIGISFPPLLHFIQTSSPYKGHPTHSLYYRSTLDHSKESKTILPMLPETLYIIQPSRRISMIHDVDDDVDTAPTTLPHYSLPQLYSSRLHRWQHGTGVAIGNETLDRRHKVNITERIMLYAIQTLHQEVMTNAVAARHTRNDRPMDDDDDIKCYKSRWPKLCQNLYTKNTTNGTVGGFPFLAWYGDYTGCNYHNWNTAYNDTAEPISRQDLAIKITENVSIPMFTVAAQAKCNYTIPFPNFYQISESMDHRTEWDMRMAQHRHDYPWSTKISKIVWRGSLTGRIDNNVTKCPRWTMVQTIHQIETQRRAIKEHQQLQVKQHPHAVNATIATRTMEASGLFSPSPSSAPSIVSSDDHEIFDARITYIHNTEKQYQNQLEHDIGDQPIAYSRLKFHEFQKYRGIIDIDGHSWSGRFGSLLCLNSVILKVDPEFVEYFYARHNSNRQHGSMDDHDNELQAWKHYIPIKSDFSNIQEMAEYVLDPANDIVLQEIVHNANEWCRHNMITSTIMSDMLDVWDRYVELLNINNNHWTDQHWTEDIQAAILNDRNLYMALLNISDYPILEG